MTFTSGQTNNNSTPLPYLTCLFSGVSKETQQNLRFVTNTVLLVLWVSVGEEVMNKCDGVRLNAILYDKNTLEVYGSFCPLRFVTDIAKLSARDLFFDLWWRTENPRLIGRREYELSILTTLWNKEKLIAHFSMTPLLTRSISAK